jgi:curved DNA-binding protein
MQYKDYYKILGVDKGADEDAIKKAYRRLARKYHPDVSKERNAEERFKEVGEAYEVLKDKKKRAAYDQVGSGYQAGQDFRPPPGWGGFNQRGPAQGPGAARGGMGGGGGEGFSDFFETLFGGGFGGAGGGRGGFSSRGQDENAKILISIEDAYNGASRNLQLQVPELGPQGRTTMRKRTLQVKIPKGITHGQKIRLSGQGGPGRGGGANGDLLLEIDLQSHPLYSVDGKDITLKLPVSPWEAALGGKVPVPTLGGKVELTVPKGTRSGQKMRLKGRGLPGKLAGDLFVVFEIQNPRRLSAEQQAFYEHMAKDGGFNPRGEMGV